jgi:DNA-binding MarR family transcriptional regulator
MQTPPPLPDLAILQLWQLSVTFETRLAAELAELGLSVSTFRLIGEVMQEPHGIRQGELARRLGVRPPTVSTAVSKLERDGLLVRIKDPDDPRARRVRLAQNADLGPGLDVLMRLERTLMEGLGTAEQSTMRDVLATLSHRLQAPETS